MPDSSDTTFDPPIPVLDEVLVQGNPDHRRPARGVDTAAAVVADEATVDAAAHEMPHEMPHAPEAEPADGVTVHSVTHAHVQAFDLPEPPAPFELAEAPELAPFEPNSSFHFARAPAAPAAPAHSLDADLLAERLRGRFASYLTGEGRSLIEARCRDALQDHTTWLVNQITREVALALETEMTGWVREAVEEEIARRSTAH